MQISKNKVVSIHYQLFNEAGDEVESTLGSQPTMFLAGAHNMMVPGLELALAGKQAGDKVNVTLAAHEAYGMRQDNQQRLSAKYLKHEGKLKPGQVVHIRADQGTKVATVVKVGKFSVDVDFNHPLAGQQVTFKVEVIDVREATAEELAHGHAHGVGGHHH